MTPFGTVDILHPARNQSHVTAIGMIGRTTPNLDPGVFYSKVWNKNKKCAQNTTCDDNDDFVPNGRRLWYLVIEFMG